MNLPLDHDIYKQLTKISYTEHILLSKLINDRLMEHTNVYPLWRKIGYVLISKEVLKSSLLRLTDEELPEYAEKIAARYREAAILMHGRPGLETYIDLIKAFVTSNRYSVEKSRNGDNDVLIVQFNVNEKYSKVSWQCVQGPA